MKYEFETDDDRSYFLTILLARMPIKCIEEKDRLFPIPLFPRCETAKEQKNSVYTIGDL